MRDEELGIDKEQGLMTGISDQNLFAREKKKKRKKETGDGVINAGYLGIGPLEMISRYL